MQLVGRDAEVAALTEAITGAAHGRGRVVLLSGEAGIGKSRLAAEALNVARQHGFTTLEGRANPLHAGLAYAPVVEALRGFLGRLPAEEFTALLDGLGDLARLLADPRLPPAAPLGDHELEKTRMFDAAVRLLHRIAERSPVLLFVDDLHWADLGTIELAHYLGRGVAGHPALLLASYRTADGPLRDLAMSVRRSEPDLELNLAPLSDSAVAELVRVLLGGEPEVALLRNVTKPSSGVPLFVTALLHGGARHTLGLPVIVRDVVLDVLRGLDDPERRLLELIAVAGDAGSDEVLRAVRDGQDADYQPALRRLLGDGLVAEQVGRAVTYRVGHPLYAEVAYAELTAAERRGVHAALGLAIARLDPTDVLSLAPHYLGAGDLIASDRTGAVLADAGWRALNVHADEEALRYLGAALAEARASGRTDLLPALLEGFGLARQRCGQVDEAMASWREALTLAELDAGVNLVRALRTRLAISEFERGNLTLADQPTLA